ncbi:MAG TPA: hypothetical protein VL359_05960, partial [bacterium]|nr:hypothetical protein [bacterium]
MTLQFKTPLNLMTEAQREWFASALVSMILADGNITQGEVETLMGSIGFVSNPQAVERLKKFVHFRSMPTLNAFRGWEREIR